MAQDVGGVQRDLQLLLAFEVALPLGQLQAPLEERLLLLVDDELGSELLQGALSKGPHIEFDPSATFHCRSYAARRLASSSETRSYVCSTRAVASRLGGTLGRPIAG